MEDLKRRLNEELIFGYYCFNNNKKARGSQALARSWRPMGVLGRGRGEVSGGQRWRVKKEKVGDLG